MNHYFYDFELYQSPIDIIPEEYLHGNNEKGLLVVVNGSDYSEENQTFLSKVLSAVSLDLGKDTLVLSLPGEEQYAVNQLCKRSSSTHCFLFGIDPKSVGFSIDTFYYTPFEIAGTQFLVGHSLEQIKSNTAHKKALWSALQHIYK